MSFKNKTKTDCFQKNWTAEKAKKMSGKKEILYNEKLHLLKGIKSIINANMDKQIIFISLKNNWELKQKWKLLCSLQHI